MNVQKEYAPTILRVVLGALFIIPGLQKLMNPAMIIGMLGGLGIPASALLGWVLILSEIGFGTAVLTGWKLDKTVWPLIIILLVATVKVHIPAFFSQTPMALISVLFHLTAIGALISLYFSGPGEKAVKQK
jgi:putative oxidoreductase